MFSCCSVVVMFPIPSSIAVACAEDVYSKEPDKRVRKRKKMNIDILAVRNCIVKRTKLKFILELYLMSKIIAKNQHDYT